MPVIQGIINISSTSASVTDIVNASHISNKAGELHLDGVDRVLVHAFKCGIYQARIHNACTRISGVVEANHTTYPVLSTTQNLVKLDKCHF